MGLMLRPAGLGGGLLSSDREHHYMSSFGPVCFLITLSILCFGLLNGETALS